ncbi:hypothetical protein BVG79_01736 [Ketogulonicigenium robustum]|uniref:5-bromo-4-chloroindolyl phosphate hydrolysis protein n=1 Tax=Ketogulonicigenium robustum TaxID=92947 RepID=A0A1W6P179_9RHOB|nr:5-bromo-4-chloroindolyl phosphate hydrolysis family protein [Ketogulonicigenium robustum]ARO15080.1 hypothetical protein BVG79_01736 [Ketogulonicigenium robustum]
MAREYGGKYSPTPHDDDKIPGAKAALRDARAETRRVDKAGARANVLFIPAFIVAILSLGRGALGMAAGLSGAAFILLAAWLMREGLRAEAAYDARTIARRPAIPRKIMAAVGFGLGTALMAISAGTAPVFGVVYGVIASVLTLGAFGVDPLRDKRAEGIDAFQQNRVARIVDEAESYLGVMQGQITTLNDRALTAKVEGVALSARRMIRTVEEDPRDLTAARKFLGVYLMGARDATVKFVDLYRRTRDTTARTDYETLLDDLQTQFTASTTRMLSDGRADMDIEIKVLRERLQREGIPTE